MSKKQKPKLSKEQLIKLAKVKPKKENVINMEAKVELLSFSVKATIPTMMYGNIMPEIVVKAPNLETAQAYALPVIEDLFKTYCEVPLKKHEAVTATERVVPIVPVGVSKETAPIVPVGVSKETAPIVPVGVSKETAPRAPEGMGIARPAIIANSEVTVKGSAEPTAPAVKTDSYIKAENAIQSAMSKEALDLVHEKIKVSVKIKEEDKQFLYDLIINKNWTMK